MPTFIQVPTLIKCWLNSHASVIRVPTLIRDVIVAILNFRADSTVSIAESVCFDFHALAISQCV